MKYLHFVRDAVYAYAQALHNLHAAECGGQPGVCQRMLSANGSVLKFYLENADFEGCSCFAYFMHGHVTCISVGTISLGKKLVCIFHDQSFGWFIFQSVPSLFDWLNWGLIESLQCWLGLGLLNGIDTVKRCWKCESNFARNWFPDQNKKLFKFYKGGDGPPRYSILNFQKELDGSYVWKEIGSSYRNSHFYFLFRFSGSSAFNVQQQQALIRWNPMLTACCRPFSGLPPQLVCPITN